MLFYAEMLILQASIFSNKHINVQKTILVVRRFRIFENDDKKWANGESGNFSKNISYNH